MSFKALNDLASLQLHLTLFCSSSMISSHPGLPSALQKYKIPFPPQALHLFLFSGTVSSPLLGPLLGLQFFEQLMYSHFSAKKPPVSMTISFIPFPFILLFYFLYSTYHYLKVSDLFAYLFVSPSGLYMQVVNSMRSGTLSHS